MRFFEKLRIEVFIHLAKLRRDKKTGKRFWCFTLITTFGIDQALRCDGTLEAAYAYLLTLENCASEVFLDTLVLDCTVDFFALQPDVVRAMRLEHVEIKGLRMTRDAKTAELWMQFENDIERPEGLHAWVKKFAYTRLWAEFTPAQASLGAGLERQATLTEDPAFLAAADRLASAVRSGEVGGMTITGPGMEPVVIDQAAADAIHKAAVKSKRKRDPG